MMTTGGLIDGLRFAVKRLAAKPGFALVAILTLALGIGANTAVFSMLNGYFLKPLPYPHANRLAQVSVVHRATRLKTSRVSLPLYRAIDTRTDTFSSSAFYVTGTSALTTGGLTRHVVSVYSSASLFPLLGIHPLLGHAFTAADTEAGNSNVALISYALWHDTFGADPHIIGKTVKFDDGMRRIVGVMPQGFAFPGRNAAVWLPYAATPGAFSPGNGRTFNLDVHFIGTLKPGVAASAAQTQIQHALVTWIHANISARLQNRFVRKPGFAISVTPWRQVLLGDRAKTLWLLQGAVLLILLITCVNVANLLLSRILGRRHEIAIRSALGATRTALARQLLVEALCLTGPGGLAGVALAWLALHLGAGSMLGTGHTIFSAALDWRVGVFALLAVLLTAGLISLLPVRYLSGTNLQAILKDGGRHGGGRSRHIRNALVVTELTLAAGLLAVAGLLLHSFVNLEGVNPGFRKDHLLVARLLVPQQDRLGNKAMRTLYTHLTHRVEALPGVRQASLTRVFPLLGGHTNGFFPNTVFAITSRKHPASGAPPTAMFNFVGRGYFKVMGIPLLRGRGFRAHDEKEPTVIIGAGLAKRYFHGTDPIGQQIDPGPHGGTRYTVVGVVPSIRYTGLSNSSGLKTIYFDDAYLGGSYRPSSIMTLVVHTALPPGTLAKPLKKLVASTHPAVALYDVHTLHELLADSLHHRHTTMVLLLAFGGIALALAVIGVYALFSYAVRQRRTEFGIRLALGAVPEGIQKLVLLDGMKLLGIGLVTGLALAVLSGQLLSSLLFGVMPYDPLTLGITTSVLFATTLFACYLPARRTTRLDTAAVIHEQ